MVLAAAVARCKVFRHGFFPADADLNQTAAASTVLGSGQCVAYRLLARNNVREPPLKYWNIRLLLVEDHSLVRDGLKRILSSAPEVRAIGESMDVPSALQQLREGDWDAMLIDLTLQGCSGVDVITQARALKPRMPILALCRHGHDPCAHRALSCGASGYLAADSSGEDLKRALRAVTRGGRYVSASLAGRPGARGDHSAAAPPHDSLSAREFQVLRLIGAGRTPTQIAGELSLSVKTVATYRTRVLRKLELHNSSEIMRYAFANDFVHCRSVAGGGMRVTGET
jgi:DNA-binding NarL/FixJ family response regulator